MFCRVIRFDCPGQKRIYGRGDLHIVVQVNTPRKLTKEQRKLLEQLAAALPSDEAKPRTQRDEDERSVFERVKDIFS